MDLCDLPGEAGKYVKLRDPTDQLHLEVQAVAHASRVQQIHSWWVMAAPIGQRFCVVRAQSKNFAANATQW